MPVSSVATREVVGQAGQEQPQGAKTQDHQQAAEQVPGIAKPDVQEPPADGTGQPQQAEAKSKSKGGVLWRRRIFTWLHRWLDDPNSVFASVVALFTVVLALVTRKQIQLTREALTATERAFVYLKSIDMVTMRDEHRNVKSHRFLPVWANSGTTPTKNMTTKINVAPYRGDLPKDWKYPYKKVPTEHHMFLGPHAEAAGDWIDISAAALNKGQADGMNLYLWGKVDYGDIFIGTQPHFTQFCFKVTVERDPADPGSYWLGYPHYGSYNGSDDDGRNRKPWWRGLLTRNPAA